MEDHKSVIMDSKEITESIIKFCNIPRHAYLYKNFHRIFINYIIKNFNRIFYNFP